ncbi:MAG: DUF3788 family protein [Bacteroidetes bacterium]|nr:MAG: DUF3788 family protein [Bacteroidota bacterium]
METSIFTNKSVVPDNASLAGALGSSFKYWVTIKQHVEETYGECVEEWKFYSQKSGWTLKLLHKKRNFFFFTPLKNYFRLGFVFGDKAVAEIERSDLPKSIIDELVNAKKYAEGRGVRIEVKTKKDVAIVKKLVEVKMGK